MADEHRESDSPKKKNDPVRREEERHAEGVEETSPGPSQRKSESSSRVVQSVGGNSQATGTNLAPSKSCASCGAETGAIPKTAQKKKGLFAKWKSPLKKKTGRSRPSAGSDKGSPDKQQRPATVSKGPFSGIIKSVRKIFGSKSGKSEKTPLTQQEAVSRPHGEGTSSRISKETSPETPWKPMHQDVTDQTWENLGGVLTTSDETVFFVNTEMTSLSGSASVGVENASALSSVRMDSFEGSAGDSSSLEKEFQNLSSPSKGTKGKKRSQNPLDEEECAVESGVSPRKRPAFDDTDREKK